MFAAHGSGREREITSGARPFTTINQVVSVIATLLDRKARKNGVVRHLASTLKYTGACSYVYPKSRFARRTGFSCRIVPNEQIFRVWLAAESDDTEILIKRLNARESLCIAIAKSKERAKATRGTHKKRHGAARAIAGASGRLKQHFRKSPITLDLAAQAIAYATNESKVDVYRELYASMELNGGSIGTIRKNRFVFRVELPTFGHGLVDINGYVSFSTTNDNTHRAYQRIRRFLKRRLNRVRKKDRERQELVLAARKQRRMQEALFRKYA